MTMSPDDARTEAASTVRHMTSNVPVVAPGTPAAQIRDMLQQQRFDSVVDVAVCDGRQLLGLIPIAGLLTAVPSVTARELMDDDPPVVHSSVDQEEAAWKAVRHGESSLAVVDEEARFVGLVPPPRLLEVLLAEHEQDLARLSGVLHRDGDARSFSLEPLRRRFGHRLPWLLVGLGGALATATLMGGFEGRLERNVTLAFFVPAIVYLADAVGTQTETLIVRGLAVGVRIRDVIGRELVTGTLVGLVLALLAGPISWVLWRDERAALAFAVALLAACTVASVVAVSLPTVLQRFGLDPAYGSGPVATVIQDILSIAIYFTCAVLLGA
jgi:magnesium transporter